MKNIFLKIILLTCIFSLQAQEVKVMNLGSFHFNFPNLDVQKTQKENQIDVLEERYQKEIEAIVDKLAKFKPTIIVIERYPKHQKKYDSLYNAYLKGKHVLKRNEEQQIGFRLAKKLGIKRLYCVDENSRYYSDIEKDSFEWKYEVLSKNGEWEAISKISAKRKVN